MQHDPATPLVNGQLVHSYLPKSSALLVQNGVGVSSLVLPRTFSTDTSLRLRLSHE